MNENTFVGNFFFHNVFLSHCFSLMPVFLSSEQFQNRSIVKSFITVQRIFIEVQLKKQNFESVLLGLPNRYSGLQNSLDTPLAHM